MIIESLDRPCREARALAQLSMHHRALDTLQDGPVLTFFVGRLTTGCTETQKLS